MRWLRRALRWLLLGVAGAWLILLTLWLVLHWAILPNVDRWRPELEARASQWTGSSVRIGALSVRTSGWMPVLELRDVRLLDAQGQPAVALPQVTAALSARSFLALVPRLEQLYLHEPVLALRIDRDGQLWVGGQPLRQGGDSTALTDWLLAQHEVAIQGGTVTWVDERRPEATPLALTKVDALLRNSLRRHEARIDATPPAAWGQRFSVRARFTQPLLARAGDWRRWSGLMYAELPEADLAAWRQQVTLPLALTQGRGPIARLGRAGQRPHPRRDGRPRPDERGPAPGQGRGAPEPARVANAPGLASPARGLALASQGPAVPLGRQCPGALGPPAKSP